MPAVSPARLKKDVAQLGDLFTSPDEFGAALGRVLDFYADRTLRPGQSGQPPPLIPAYNVPRPVLRQIETELAQQAAIHPEEALRLADKLWASQELECKLLAIRTLENTPIIFGEEIHARVQAWAQPSEPAELLAGLFSSAVKTRPQAILALVEGWLAIPEAPFQAMGLLALQTLAETGNDDLLPALFRLLGGLVSRTNADTKMKLPELTRMLGRRNPRETAFFLRQNFIITEQAQIGWLIRQTLPAFPVDVQAELRQFMRENR